MIPLGLAQELETMDEMESESEGESVCSIHMECNECSGENTVVYDREVLWRFGYCDCDCDDCVRAIFTKERYTILDDSSEQVLGSS